MNKDFQPSKKYEPEDFARFNIPFYFQDSCGDHYHDYQKCKHATSFVYLNPLASFLFKEKSCQKIYYRWERCEVQREKEVEGKLSEYLKYKLAK